MPSRSLIPSQTAVSIHLGTRILPSPHETSSREMSVSHRHLSFLRHMNGFWKGFALRSKKQLTSGGRIKSGPVLVSEPTPGPPRPAFSPPSPTLQTPDSLSCDDVESDDWPWITVSSTEVGDVSVRPVQSLYPDLSRASVELFPEPCRRHRVSRSENSGLSCMASTSPVIGASGSILDAATRLQDFRSLILEMRASLLDHDHETAVDVRERDEEEIEGLLRLLEDVMTKVRGLAERDIPDPGLPVIKIDVAP
ncbi:hypothetical protein EDB92DRAFT_1890940 [Lactarius akahatsu]|uniref:Uncharacterized protein n=1 Tax=Lactarius akahatsu TaxID=416441 RepID=A0AAD4LDW1_9AGAM|nr:hypothetical protein EDB92DRAFT_1890940 [Lactarius akahatsu]